jgi:hypothetical protein
MSQGGIDSCTALAAGRGFDGFTAVNQGGLQSCYFFVEENMSSPSGCGFTRFPDAEVLGYDSPDVISYIIPRKKSDVWVEGWLGDWADRSHSELWNVPYMSQGGIDSCTALAAGRGFDGFTAVNQGGQQACYFFVDENMSSPSGSLISCDFTRFPDSEVLGYNSDPISYIMPVCTNYPTWLDGFGDGCDWYELVNDGCANAGSYVNTCNIGADAACCFCSGGLADGESEPTC